METIGSKRSYALIWCMPNNDDDDYRPISGCLQLLEILEIWNLIGPPENFCARCRTPTSRLVFIVFWIPVIAL